MKGVVIDMGKIEFCKVSFSYPGCDSKALDAIDLTISPAAFVLVCGKSGCGKSTLLRQMKKNLIPFGDLQGEVLYHGTPIHQLDARVSAQEIGFVGQNPDHQIVTDKVWHELAFGLESLGYDQQTIRRRVAEMASFFGIQSWFRRSISELSGGQKQLLNLASVMAMQPKVLILDEPTAQLDPITATEFLGTLKRINQELGTTIILSEHRLEEVFPMADQVAVLDQGKLLISDQPESVAAYLSEHQNVMYQGLPAPMKIYAAVKPEGKCPLTVREGRLWLSRLFTNKIEQNAIGNVPQDVSPATNQEVIALDHVWFRYSARDEDVLRGVTLTVKKGELLCLVGGNGVGKSTTLKLINGLHKPYRGKVTIGKAESGAALSISTLPQNPQAIFTEITVAEEMLEAFAYDKRSESEQQDLVEQMLRRLSLHHLKDAHPYDLSGGEQQRLALGKLLLLRPDVLLLDEPTKGLDPYFKAVLAEILGELTASGVTVLMVTHDIEFAAQHADRCAMMFDGDLISVDTPRVFFSGNSFYTTASNRMSRHLFADAVTCEDVIQLCAANLT